MIVGVISIIAIVFSVTSGQCPNVLTGNVERMMLGLTVAIFLSHLSHGYAGGAINSFEKFLPSLVGFFLVLSSIKERKQFDIFILFLIALISFVAFEGIQQYRTGYAIGGVEPFYQNAIGLDGERLSLARIRWYGLFNDPNDLGLLFIITVPFLIDMLMKRKFIIPIISLPLIIIALYHTNSRGSMLACVVAVGAYFLIRYRSKKGLIIGLMLIIPLMLFGPSRMGEISGKEESAYGRIESWYQGYQMFKSNPLFGVGMGNYTDYHYLTAHNSFVLVMAELGFVGLFCFTGLIYYPFEWLHSKLFPKGAERNFEQNDLCLISSVYASFVGVLTSIFFISRSYVLIPYLLSALATIVSRISSFDIKVQPGVVTSSSKHLINIFIMTVFQILIINLILKITI